MAYSVFVFLNKPNKFFPIQQTAKNVVVAAIIAPISACSNSGKGGGTCSATLETNSASVMVCRVPAQRTLLLLILVKLLSQYRKPAMIDSFATALRLLDQCSV